ncbi:MAG: putative baseplate assembly protein [Gemmatimonadales bacterium]
MSCTDERRRQRVRDRGLNGIDYVEIVDEEERVLCVHLFGDVPADLDPTGVRVEGGRRIRDLRVLRVERHVSSEPERESCLQVALDQTGDYSPYTLRLAAPDGATLPGFDPRYSSAVFRFKADCAGEVDCLEPDRCPPRTLVEPEPDYLSKDYASFRQLLLDRLSLVMPDWRERHVPDMGIALVELLAYVGDYLSYYQDAVATEAYLGTARRRVSVRRHARLVDYRMHEGCNARAWICVCTDDEFELDPAADWFATRCEALDRVGRWVLTPEDVRPVPEDAFAVFLPMADAGGSSLRFRPAHSRMRFYTWGDAECCLPRGATRATLVDGWMPVAEPDDEGKQVRQAAPKAAHVVPRERALQLEAGQVLILEEVLGPRTGSPADADPSHRHPVRLTRVEPREDPLTDPPTPVLEIGWHRDDALPFPLCLSARRPAPDCDLIEEVSLACGNVVLVDHGRPVEQPIPPVPPTATPGVCLCDGSVSDVVYRPGVSRPVLDRGPVTFAQPLPAPERRTGRTAAAAGLTTQAPREALPQVVLRDGTIAWEPRYDLLDSGSTDRHFVVETDDEGRAQVRFGDGDTGRAPEGDAAFVAAYRIGNGPAGNVGAGTIRYLVRPRGLVSARVRNPLPARGGLTPEPVPEVKLYAPGTFRRTLERAVTADDYGRLAERNAEVQRAAATLRWTGSWYEVQVAVDPVGTEEPEASLLREVRHRLHRYRRIGHDLTVTRASYVPIDLALTVCVEPHALRGHVLAAVREALGAARRPDGRTGWFHPDNLTFGLGVNLSAVVAVVQSVEGVAGVRVDRLQRWAGPDEGAVDRGFLPLGPDEIAQLDDDPNFRDHGTLTLVAGGGR